MSEIARSLAVFAEPPREDGAGLAELVGLSGFPEGWEYTEVFLEQLYPYASVYLDPTGKIGGEARDRVAGFWRALGEVPTPECDHLSELLAGYANLTQAAAGANDERAADAWNRSRAAFLWEHLLSWLPVWLARLDKIATPFYRSWGSLLQEWLRNEARELVLPERLPAHFRDAPAIPVPETGEGEAFLEALLAPVRSGFILTSGDLATIAAAQGLGIRAGERAYAIRSLLAQEPAATLRAVAELAHHDGGADGPIGEFWRTRAGATRAILLAAAAHSESE